MKNIIIFLLSFFIIGCSDIQKNHYKNKDEVLNDNAILRGRIPSIIPDSSYKIVEEHNLDTNDLKGSFLYLEKDENDFLKQLSESRQNLRWKDFIFIIDKKNNKVDFRNKE